MNPYADFKIEKIVHHTTPQSLQTYLYEKGFLQDMDLSKLKESLKKKDYVEVVGSQLKELIQTEATVINDFCIVHVLSKKRPFLSLAQELHLLQSHYTDSLNSLASNHDRVFWLLSVDREFTENCYYAWNARNLADRYWLIRSDVIPADAPPLTPDMIAKLKDAVVAYLPAEIRGGPCITRHFVYGGKEFLFLLTRDMPEPKECLNDLGEIEPQMLVPIMKIIFACDVENQHLNILGDSPATRQEMHKLYAKEIFGKEIPDEPQGKPVYDQEKVFQELISLKRLNPTIPKASNVKDIWVKAIRLRLKRGGEILLDTKAQKRGAEDKPDAIYDLLKKVVQVEEGRFRPIKQKDVEVIKIEFVAHYTDPLVKKEAKHNFAFIRKHGSNLGHEEIEEDIRKCLLASGYMRKGGEAANNNAIRVASKMLEAV